MDAHGKLTVDFKPTKRMKKRRELDALFNAKHQGLLSSSGKTKNGQHELLWNESESSEVEDLDLPGGRTQLKTDRSRQCLVCLVVCWGLVLLAGILSVIALSWMYARLKMDVEEVLTKLVKVQTENSILAGRLVEVGSFRESFTQQLRAFSERLDGLQANLTVHVNQVLAIEDSVRKLSRDAVGTPKSSSLLSQQLQDVSKTLERSRHVPAADAWKNPEGLGESLVIGISLFKDLSRLSKNFNLLNFTLHRKFEEASTHSKMTDESISALSNHFGLLGQRMNILEMKPKEKSQLLPSADELDRLIKSVVQSKIDILRNCSASEQEKLQRQEMQPKVYFEAFLTKVRMEAEGLNNMTRKLLAERFDRVASSFDELHNFTDSSFKLFNDQVQELTNRLKLVEVVVYTVVSDNTSSEATPNGGTDQLSDPAKSFRRIHSSTTEAVVEARNKVTQADVPGKDLPAS